MPWALRGTQSLEIPQLIRITKTAWAVPTNCGFGEPRLASAAGRHGFRNILKCIPSQANHRSQYHRGNIVLAVDQRPVEPVPIELLGTDELTESVSSEAHAVLPGDQLYHGL